MSFGFLLFPDSGGDIFFSEKLRVSLTNEMIPNRRTKFDKTNFDIYRGDDELLRFEVHSGHDLFDLSEYDVRISGRKTRQSDPLFDVTISDGSHGSDFANGNFNIFLSSSITENLPSRFKYDIQIIRNSIVQTIVSGQIRVVGEYTR